MKKSTLLLIFSAHIIFGLITIQIPLIATFHAWITLAFGLWLALTAHETQKIILVAAYITGSELIWRMVGASVFWEFGKYAVFVILGIALLRHHFRNNIFLPIIYFALLLISIPLTIEWFGFNEDARQAVSFNLSGPLSLALCVLFFSQIKLGLKEVKRIAWTITFPIVSILTIAVFSTVTSPDIVFIAESNFTTSGGFGPNQVSAILSLGAIMMFLIATTEKNGLRRIIATILLIAFLVQSLLTFSRGGIYNAGICIIFGVLQLFLSRKARIGILLGSILLCALTYYIVIPKMNDFTNGQFGIRYSDLDTTNRKEIALGELDVWFSHLIFGVGPGVSTYEVTYNLYGYTGNFAGAHTEYTRLLAEHGIFGLCALLLLLIMAIRAYIKAPDWLSKFWVAVLLLWPLVEMSHAATRVVAISFLFGLANAVWIQQPKNFTNQVKGNLSLKGLNILG